MTRRRDTLHRTPRPHPDAPSALPVRRAPSLAPVVRVSAERVVVCSKCRAARTAGEVRQMRAQMVCKDGCKA